MITKAQAIDPNNRMFYCSAESNANGTPLRMRRNGKTQVWKTHIAWRIPVKQGLHNYYNLTESNAHNWHLTENEAIAWRELSHGVEPQAWTLTQKGVIEVHMTLTAAELQAAADAQRAAHPDAGGIIIVQVAP